MGLIFLGGIGFLISSVFYSSMMSSSTLDAYDEVSEVSISTSLAPICSKKLFVATGAGSSISISWAGICSKKLFVASGAGFFCSICTNVVGIDSKKFFCRLRCRVLLFHLYFLDFDL